MYPKSYQQDDIGYTDDKLSKMCKTEGSNNNMQHVTLVNLILLYELSAYISCRIILVLNGGVNAYFIMLQMCNCDQRFPKKSNLHSHTLTFFSPAVFKSHRSF